MPVLLQFCTFFFSSWNHIIPVKDIFRFSCGYLYLPEEEEEQAKTGEKSKIQREGRKEEGGGRDHAIRFEREREKKRGGKPEPNISSASGKNNVLENRMEMTKKKKNKKNLISNPCGSSGKRKRKRRRAKFFFLSFSIVFLIAAENMLCNSYYYHYLANAQLLGFVLSNRVYAAKSAVIATF